MGTALPSHGCFRMLSFSPSMGINRFGTLMTIWLLWVLNTMLGKNWTLDPESHIRNRSSNGKSKIDSSEKYPSANPWYVFLDSFLNQHSEQDHRRRRLAGGSWEGTKLAVHFGELNTLASLWRFIIYQWNCSRKWLNLED